MAADPPPSSPPRSVPHSGVPCQRGCQRSGATYEGGGACRPIAVLVALLVALAIIVGSQRRLPPPLGIAKPGLIAFDLNGTIWTANPDGTGRRRLTSGPSDGGETFSPDGTEIAYAAAARDMSTSLIVMDADGGHPRTVAEHLAEVGDIVWSPDSRRVAFSGHILDESGSTSSPRPSTIRATSDSGGLTSSGWSLPGPRTAETSLSSTRQCRRYRLRHWRPVADATLMDPIRGFFPRLAAVPTRCSAQRGRQTANGSRSWPTA